MKRSESHLARLLAHHQRVFSRISARRTRVDAPHGLTNSQTSVLNAVKSNEKCTMSELADDQLVKLPAATRTVNELAKRNLVERITDDNDRRRVRLRLTEEGRRVSDEVGDETEDLWTRALERMSEDEREALRKGLNGLTEAVIAIEGEDKNAQTKKN